MPKPCYIVFANDVIEDKDTNLVTIVKVIEVMSVTAIAKPADGQPQQVTVDLQTMGVPSIFRASKAMAVWRRSEGDTGDFEHEFVFAVGNTPREVGHTTFQFDSVKSLKRFSLTMFGFPAPESSCLGHITSRLRQVGDTTWQEQTYSFEIKVTRAGEAETEAIATQQVAPPPE